MDIAEFNALKLRVDDHVKVIVNQQLQAPGLTGEETAPRIGYLYGIGNSGFDVYVMISTLPQRCFEGYSQVHREDIKEIHIFERSQEGELVQIAIGEDGKGFRVA